MLQFPKCVAYPEFEFSFHFFFISGCSGEQAFFLLFWEEYVGDIGSGASMQMYAFIVFCITVVFECMFCKHTEGGGTWGLFFWEIAVEEGGVFPGFQDEFKPVTMIPVFLSFCSRWGHVLAPILEALCEEAL